MVGSDAASDSAHIAGDGDYAIEVVSGSRHQDRLEWLAQGRGEEPADYVCTVLLLPEPDNPFDPNAVSVSVRGVRIGYLPADAAASMSAAMRTWGFDRATCAAIIEGGWYRSAEDKGDFCVRLDANPDFEPAALPGVDRPRPRPIAVVAAVNARKTAYDLGLGAIATFAMLALIGIVWLVVQPTAQPLKSDYPAAASSPQTSASAQPREAASAPRGGARDTLERAVLLGDAGRPRGAGESGAASTDARRDPTPVVAKVDQPPASKPPASRPSDLRPVVADIEAVKEVSAVPPPEPVKAVASSAEPGAAAARRESTPADAAVEGRLSLAAIGPGEAEEVGPVPDRRHALPAVAAPTAEQVPSTAGASPPALPPAPQPASSGSQAAAGPDVRNGEAGAAQRASSAVTPASGSDNRRASLPAAESTPGTPPVAAAEPTARPQRKAGSQPRASRASARSRAARLKARSRNAARYSRRSRRAVQSRRDQRPSPPSPSAEVATPGLTPAARMFQGWTRELTTRPLPGGSVQPRPAQQ